MENLIFVFNVTNRFQYGSVKLLPVYTSCFSKLVVFHAFQIIEKQQISLLSTLVFLPSPCTIIGISGSIHLILGVMQASNLVLLALGVNATAQKKASLISWSFCLMTLSKTESNTIHDNVMGPLDKLVLVTERCGTITAPVTFALLDPSLHDQ